MATFSRDGANYCFRLGAQFYGTHLPFYGLCAGVQQIQGSEHDHDCF